MFYSDNSTKRRLSENNKQFALFQKLKHKLERTHGELHDTIKKTDSNKKLKKDNKFKVSKQKY